MERLVAAIHLLAWMSLAVATEQRTTGDGFLRTYCVDCHGEVTQEGRFRADVLADRFETKEAQSAWGRVILRLEAGEMPPAEVPRPAPGESGRFLLELKETLARTASVQRPEGRLRMRRLNRLEYENTMRDLLGIDTPFQSLLPEDDLADGFSTASSALSISPVHIQQYMAAADLAIEEATVRQARPETKTHRFSYVADEEKPFHGHAHNKLLCSLRGEDLFFFGPTHIEVPAYLRQFDSLTRTTPGRYRVRVTTEARDTPDGADLVYSVWLAAGGIRRELIGFFDARHDQPTTIEFTRAFGRGETLIVAPHDMSRIRTDAGYSIYLPDKRENVPKEWHPINNPNPHIPTVGPALVVKPLEITGPLVEQWPPRGHRLLYGDAPLVPAADAAKTARVPASILRPMRGFRVLSDPLTVRPDGDLAAAVIVPLLTDFVTRAYRRPVSPEEVEPYAEMVRRSLMAGDCFERAMNTSHRAVLCSPNFLFLIRENPELHVHALASRLSYFLWRSSPDDTLLERARSGELVRPGVLRSEATRLMAEARFDACVADFLDQWLNLRDIDATTPDRDLFPEYFSEIHSGTQDMLLHDSLLRETRAFFRHVVEDDLGVVHLVDSRIAFLNARLAEHYGLPALEGSGLRRVTLPDGSVRGGLLTQASVLKVTANGASTSPVLRGVWILKRILGTPPPPPPPDAGSIEPDTRGATTIREQLVCHTSDESCAGCHRKIDPPGFALEAFDPIGRYREFYRVTEKGEKFDAPRIFNGSGYGQAKYFKGLRVDCSSSLADGTNVADIRDYKARLARDPRPLARNLVKQLVIFATGRAVEPGDLLEVEKIVERAADNDLGVRSLMLEFIDSRLFHEHPVAIP